jgi:hypothetical protein
LALDGISVSVDMTMVAYWQLRVALWLHGKASERATSWPLVLQAITAAWAIVDDVHRIGVLVRRLPGLKRGPAVTALLKAADQVEAPRNAVQHLDGEIEELLDSGRSVWDPCLGSTWPHRTPSSCRSVCFSRARWRPPTESRWSTL